MPRPIWFEIPADNLQRAVDFYEQVFGWNISEFPNMPGYWIIQTPGGPGAAMGGGIMSREQGACTRNTIDVPSLDEYGKKIVQAGGTISNQRMPIPHATFTTAEDTEGNQFGLIEPTGEEEMREVPGRDTSGMFSVVHFEIPADDPKRAIRFYESVFGWSASKWEGPMDYWLLRTGEEGDPGMDGAIMPRGEFRCTVNTISIPNAETYSRRIEEAGGTITREKQAIPGVGWLAMCEDTERNLFGIIQTDETAGAEETVGMAEVGLLE